ncbi:hypothetical protein Trydic_g20280 [Trypoxylus dichotomus]
MEPGLKLEKYEGEDRKELPYQKLIGSLMYLSIATRPDISFAVSYFSQFNLCYGGAHWTAAKRILRYLRGTKNVYLIYKRTGKPIIGLAYVDWTSWAIDRRSHTGYCFMYAGGSLSRESRK